MAIAFRNRVPEIGSLKDRVTLQRPVTREISSYNESVTEWEDVATVWASDRVEAGDEPTEASENLAQLHHTLLIRYRSDVLPTWRLLLGERVILITGLNNVMNQRRWLEIQGTEKVAT